MIEEAKRQAQITEAREKMDEIAPKLVAVIGGMETANIFVGVAVDILRAQIGQAQTVTYLMGLAFEVDQEKPKRPAAQA